MQTTYKPGYDTFHRDFGNSSLDFYRLEFEISHIRCPRHSNWSIWKFHDHRLYLLNIHNRRHPTVPYIYAYTGWRHQMEIFSALLAFCARNSPVTGEFPTQRPVTRSFDVFFDLCLTKRLSKQWWGWWFETPSCPLCRHRNDIDVNWTVPNISVWMYSRTKLNFI